MTSKRKIFFMIFLLIAPEIHAQLINPLTIQQVLMLAEKNSPQISANKYESLAAIQSINTAQAAYFPSINFEAIDSTGFPGSSSGTDVEGLMGSPYRQGWGYGLVAQQNILDFGRTASNIKASQYQAQLSEDTVKVTRDQIKQLALQTYYECSFYRTQINTWTKLNQESAMITDQVNHFVNTGQRSVVDGDLSQAQTEQTSTELAYFNSRLIDATYRLAVILGVSNKSIACPPLPDASSLNTPSNLFASPLLAQAQASADIAHAKASQAKANYYPQIIAIASVGDLENVRLVQSKDYSAGIGIIFPLFNLGTHSDVSRAELAAAAQDADVAAEQQNLTEINANYDEIIDSSNIKLQHLAKELSLANKAFTEAKSRYFSFEGDLVDLREAFNNLARTENEINETRAELLETSGTKILTNGGEI